jgi:solute carrier family 25 (mitochondrial phosphate transporter), member 3
LSPISGYVAFSHSLLRQKHINKPATLSMSPNVVELSSTAMNSIDMTQMSQSHVDSLLHMNQLLLASGISTVQYNPVVYFLAGGICASFSHGVAIPVDVVKTRQQTKADYASLTPIESFQKLMNEDGPSALLQGTAPTLIGYGIQGSIKYGLYEYFKPFVASFLSYIGLTHFCGDNETTNTILDFIISGALAELFGSTTLVPFEAARITLVSNPNYASDMKSCVNKLIADKGIKYLFLGLPAILAKQIPFAMVSLSSFEMISKYIYQSVLGVGTAIVSNPTIGVGTVSDALVGTEVENQLGTTIITSVETALVTVESIDFEKRFIVTLISALISGILGAIVSQPGDTLLSVVNNSNKQSIESTEGAVSKSVGSRAVMPSSTSTSTSNGEAETLDVITIMKESISDLGIKGLFGGFQARLYHVMLIITVQLLVYDFTKSYIGQMIG